jgi:hypothetical protein
VYEFSAVVLLYKASLNDFDKIRYHSDTLYKEHPNSEHKEEGGWQECWCSPKFWLTCLFGKESKGSKNSNVEFFKITIEDDRPGAEVMGVGATPEDKRVEQIDKKIDAMET